MEDGVVRSEAIRRRSSLGRVRSGIFVCMCGWRLQSVDVDSCASGVS